MAFPMQLLSSAIRRMRFGNPKALRCISLYGCTVCQLWRYWRLISKRWPIELFFRQSKSKLALDKYQLRSRQGIQRYWLIMSLVHFLCCMHSGSYCAFEEGYASLTATAKAGTAHKSVPVYQKWCFNSKLLMELAG